jgi:Fic family protein
MMSFRADYLARLTVPTGAVWLIGDIMEGKGRHELFVKQSPDLVQALREAALVQSVESSNRIEGVTIEPSRLVPLVLGHARPRDRSEQEIRGYRRALAMIHARPRELPITPELVCELHALAQEARGDAGAWKRTDNEIVELRPGRPPRVRFRPVSAADTPAAMEELCRAYRTTVDQSLAPPLVAVAALILDFLCIHPFRDGNGRVSRLLTLLALYQQGLEVGRYISLERLVEEEKSRYYETLEASSRGWHEGTHDIHPWLLFFLSILGAATREFEQRASGQKRPRGAKRALVEQAIDAFPGAFSLADLERACPGVSRDMIRRVLSDLRKAGRLSCTGRGPGARWGKERNTSKRM